MQFLIPHKAPIVVLLAGVSVLAAACGQQSVTPTTRPTAAPTVAAANVPTNVATTAPTEVSPAGDVPDNAVFVTYTSPSGLYSIQYVEGWSVEQLTNDGVSITDIDSSEVVNIVPLPSGDLTNYVNATDEPQLKSSVQDYQRIDLKTVQVHNQPVVVLSYNSTSAPDAVTGKQRAVTSLRYYLPGHNGQLAILTLTTPPDVDNVDAFNQMLGSFTWTA